RHARGENHARFALRERALAFGLLAARVTPDTATTAEDVLRATGAKSIERVEGDWQDGEWRDFDPVRRPDEAPSGGPR
ncbi:hypothetical protein QM306_36210, partial [Burkholderia cenocepacia]|nr:hypothetical protein [Burkholderia cenocepacia]